MRLSKRGLGAEESATLAISGKAKAMKAQGRDVVNFGVGEPDFDTPEHIREAAKYAIDHGYTRYTPAAGTLELKKAICAELSRDRNLEYTPEEIVVSNGAKHSIFNAMMALLDPGEEIILPTPCWVSYPEMARMCGGVPVFVEGSEENGFRAKIADIEAAVTPHTKCILINNPNNPTGAMYTREELEELAEVAKRHDIYIISDEIYDKLVYDGRRVVSIASLSEDARARTIVINGASKTYAMTGWRIGWAAAPKDCAKVMANIQSQATSNPNSVAQYAVAAALTGPDDEIREMAAEFEKRRNRMVELLNQSEDITARKPEGAFYVFANIKKLMGKTIDGEIITDSMAFAHLLLEKEGVAVVPGVAFGAEGYIRLSYALGMPCIEKGVSRLMDFAQRAK
ncbi:MAG: pyridoxal phosphate-dependent aminotransferase [Eubacteriales bacterium]|nr:pyridoxal phosphate-dependent aminotransferase [Eubacteriales bacterium]